MAMESTLQVRMDSALKAEVEALYKSLGIRGSSSHLRAAEHP